MIQSASVFTYETENHEEALKDIQSQLSEKLKLMKYTAGIMHCGDDFIESGVASYISKMLPFAIVGATTNLQSINETYGAFMLTLTVMTSDDVAFVTSHTEGILEDLFGSVERSFPNKEELPDMPLKLILAYPPLADVLSGDNFANAFEAIYGKVPVFGSIAVEEEIMTSERNSVICNGKCFKNEMSYLLIYGNVNPRFFISNIRQSNLMQAGTITKASDNVVHEIDGITAIDFFKNIGFVQNNAMKNGVEFVPFVLTVKDGNETTQFIRGLVNFDDNGSIQCRGTMYEGAVLSIGSNSAEDIISSSLNTTEIINAEDNIQLALIYSCIVRRTVLISNPQIELETVRKAIRQDIPHMMAYAGGEICPHPLASNTVINRFHNFSLIACLL